MKKLASILLGLSLLLGATAFASDDHDKDHKSDKKHKEDHKGDKDKKKHAS